MSTKTIFDAYSDFEAANTKGNKLIVRSVIHRFLAESWGGQAPQGSKATNEEVFKFLELIKSLPSTSLVGSMETLEYKFIEKKVTKDKTKSYKSAYKAFINWAEDNNYFLKVEEIAEVQSPIKLFKRSPNGSKKVKNNHGQTVKKTYALMGRHINGELVYPTDYANNHLAHELKEFEKFRKEEHACSPATIKSNIIHIFQILGWLYRYKNISLEDLSLTSIITYIKLNVSIKEFKKKLGKINSQILTSEEHQQFTFEKALVREESFEIANENISLIKDYFDFVGGHPNTKLVKLATIIAVAKFVFRNEIGTNDYVDETDLVIIRRLNQLSNKLNKLAKNTPASVPHSKKSIPLEQAMSILNTLSLKADCLFIETEVPYKVKSGEIRTCIHKAKRSKNAIANDLQDFLAVAFMVLIPTDRARTYYELEINRTFVYGFWDGVKFTSANKLEDKTIVKWYIHLMSEDYKTGKKYKEYWGIMPDVNFGGEKTLYKYINRWLNSERDYRKKCNHALFFRGRNKYQPLSSGGWGNYITTIFEKETDVPVTPKEIRKMYVTYLNNTGATDSEMKGAAYAMHHSKHMQENIYNSQTILERLRPIFERNEAMHKEFFGENSQYED